MDHDVDYYKKYRLALIVIAVLVILNVVTMSFILLSPIGRGLFDGREHIQSTLEDELHFTDLQKKQFADLRAQHFAHGDSMAAIEFRTMDSLFAMLRQQSVNGNDVRHFTETLGGIATTRHAGLFEHFREVRAICTPEQQVRFDTVIVKVLQMIRDPRGPRPKDPPPR
jgi:periplasmic protein CpxP/Spy